ncbi:hypothetical protein SAMN05518863_11062 [Candidatus Pantoea symbiotica]|jgi:hypothetical protein|uniref:Urease alpha-subunit N-terminal domain-containing protein n=1 Tax=Candidatus Pantoea symbiotica TaxID=1884370 RepID=A0A1I4CJI0_9GAMM|nr:MULTISPECIES: hypothetical protein [Pantoea]KAJ9430883.1 hypothetical protein PMI39_000440 [Pantoea sp. YR343]SFK80447.1 hypothetical protein SAMN05518863_11062 [Pantoea symbiotica]SFV02194.1 hypothetical protein SAMN05518864_11062 [Pantoea sp. YR525]
MATDLRVSDKHDAIYGDIVIRAVDGKVAMNGDPTVNRGGGRG